MDRTEQWFRLLGFRLLGAILLAVVVSGPVIGLGAGLPVAVAQTVEPTETTTPSDQPGATETQPAPTPTPTTDPDVATEDEPDPSPDATEPPGSEASPDPDDTAEPDTEPDATIEPTPDSVAPGDGGVAPSVRRSSIPGATVSVALAVLAAVAVAALVLTQGRTRPSGQPLDPPLGPPPPGDRDPAGDRELVAFLLDLGGALLDSGDAVNSVEVTLRAVARRHGLADIGVIVLPTAIILSLPGREIAQTDIVAVGTGPLRLDQVEAVLRLVDRARDGTIDPARGRREVAAIRASASPVPTQLALVGNVVAAVGLALLLRGGLLELVVAGALGAVVTLVRVVLAPRGSNLRPFLPLVTAFVVATVVLLVARIAPDLAALPPLVAPLIPLLPGAMLTMGILELATGQALSGMSRLGSGGLQLVLLAGGILGAVQFVGVPAATDVVAETAATIPPGLVGELAPWLGVAAFGIGIAWARGASRSSVRWILLVLYVAYAGQVVGGLVFGTALSAFFGALAMTPVAVYASRQPHGPPSLVTFLPAFWLLVPGALGLQGVTRILSEGGVQGLATLVTTGSAMLGIALGILLGLLLAAPDRWRLGNVGPPLPERPHT